MPKLALNGIEINYRDEGQGEALVLVHNLTSNIEGFDDNVPALSLIHIYRQPGQAAGGYSRQPPWAVAAPG